MRDGILLAATVRLPPGKTLADGPFPTVIEYSGYNVAGPHSLIDALEGHASTSDPLLPDTSTVVGSVVAPLLGFATVSVQMRGTGCSGGAFDLFGLPSDYDGYDVVQTVGAQPWVLHHKVGMVGISYSGFSQLVVAGTDPPDLAAITPLSPTDDLYSTGYPGGIYNDGFAASWVAQRVSDAQAAPQGGGSTGPPPRSPPATGPAWPTNASTCRPRASSRSSARTSAARRLSSTSARRPPGPRTSRSPSSWSARSRTSRSGPQWPALVDALHGDQNVYVTMMNGTHTDSLGPDTISRWLEFLDLYVADRVPTASPTLDALAPTLYSGLTGGAPSAPVPAVRFTNGAFGRRGEGRLRQRRTPGCGCSSTTAAGPSARGRSSRPTTPGSRPGRPPAPWCTSVSGQTARCTRPRSPGTSTVSFRPDPAARPSDDLAASANAWAAQPPYNWTTVPAGNGIAFETPVFTGATTIVGPASLESGAQVDGTRHRPAGHRHRGPARRDAGGIRHLGLPAQQQSARCRPPRPPLDPVPTYLDGGPPVTPQGTLHPRPGTGRPDCAHLPGRAPGCASSSPPPAATARRGPSTHPPPTAPCSTPWRSAARTGRRWCVNEVGGVVPDLHPAGLRRAARRALPGLRPAGQPALTSGRPAPPPLGRVAVMPGTAGDRRAGRGLALRGPAHHARHPALHRRAGPRRGAARHPLRRHPGPERLEPPALPLHRPHRRAGGPRRPSA